MIGVLHVGSFEERELHRRRRGPACRAPATAPRWRSRAAWPSASAAWPTRSRRSLMPTLPDVPGVGLAGRYLPGGLGQARRRLVRRLHAARRQARPGDRRRVRPRLPGSRADGPAAQRAACLRDGPRARRPRWWSASASCSASSSPGATPRSSTCCSTRRRARLTLAGAGHPPPLDRWTEPAAAAYVELPGSVPLAAVRFARYEDVEARLEPGALARALHRWGGRAPRRVARRGPRAAAARRSAAPALRAARRCATTIIRVDAPRRSLTRDDAALLVVRALPLADPLELQPPGGRGHDPAAPARARALAARGRRASTVEIEEITLACSEACANAIEHAYAPGPAALEVHRLRLGGGGDGHLRARLRELARGAGQPPRPRHGPDEGSDGLGGRGLRRRRHNGPARAAAWGRERAVSAHPHLRARPIAARCRWRISRASSTCPRPATLRERLLDGGGEPGRGAGDRPERRDLRGQRRGEPAVRAGGAPGHAPASVRGRVSRGRHRRARVRARGPGPRSRRSTTRSTRRCTGSSPRSGHDG